MSEKSLTHRTKIQLEINGRDLTDIVEDNLVSVVFADKKGDEADDLVIVLSDTENILIGDYLNTGSGEKNKRAGKGFAIQVKIIDINPDGDGTDKLLDCGKMEIDSVSYSGPPNTVCIKAMPISYKNEFRQTKHCKMWENTTLKNMAEKMAEKNGYSLMYLADANPVYERKEQINVTDMAFLERMSKKAGLSLKITAENIILFDEAEFENINETLQLDKEAENIISFAFTTKTTECLYTKCHVKYTDPVTKKTLEYTYVPTGNSSGGNVLEIRQKVANIAEAKALSKKMLRSMNKNETIAEFEIIGNTDCMAGNTVKVSGYGDYDGRYIIEKAIHIVKKGYRTILQMHLCLEGY